MHKGLECWSTRSIHWARDEIRCCSERLTVSAGRGLTGKITAKDGRKMLAENRGIHHVNKSPGPEGVDTPTTRARVSGLDTTGWCSHRILCRSSSQATAHPPCAPAGHWGDILSRPCHGRAFAGWQGTCPTQY